jgi:prevent-host-death family protein
MDNIDLRNITPLTDFRNNIKKYLEEINIHKNPIVLTQHGKSAAVIMDAEKYQELQDQIEFMRKVALGLEDYREGRITSANDVFKQIDQILK